MSRDEGLTESRQAPRAQPVRGVSASADRKALESALEFSLVRGDLLFRLQRRIGLIPSDSLGVGRRAVLLALVTWLPLAVWALVHGRALPGGTGEPLLQHFGVNVRCLVAIPLFILGEAPAQHVITQFLLRLLEGGFVTEAELPQFRSIIARAVRMRDSGLPWVILLGFVAMWSILGPPAGGVHEVAWATEGDPAHPILGFGGWWFLYVVRAVFVTLLVVWLWRFALGCVVVARIMKLDLQLVPSHPDHAMGLGLVDRIPRAFQAFLFGVSSVMAASWAHEMLYHGVDIRSFAVPLGFFAGGMLCLMMVPSLLCAPTLGRTKRRELANYSALVARHGRLVRDRWILGREPADREILDAPELGPVADTITLYEAVRTTRPVPVTKGALIAIVLPLAIPMIALVAIQVPLKEILSVLMKALL